MPQMLSTKQYDAIAAEWEHSDGTRAFTMLVQHVLQQQGNTLWNVSVGELHAPASTFASTSQAYQYALINTDVNPAWQIAKNNELLANIKADQRLLDQRLTQSRIQHVNRMYSILARTRSSTAVATINSDILDISHSGFLDRSSMVSVGQTKSVNTISEQSIIANATTGEFYRVDSGATNYWVNKDGKYFGTDNALYDPRTDNNISE